MAVEYRTTTAGEGGIESLINYRISWGAIFAGTVVALVLQVSFSLLGMGIRVIEPTAGGVGMGAGIWLLLTSVISLFAGGWVATRMSGVLLSIEGILHGLVIWGLSTLVTFYLMTSAFGSLISAAAGALGAGFTAMMGMPTGAEVTAITDVASLPNAALWGFIGLLLGAIAAAFGGWIGRPTYLMKGAVGKEDREAAERFRKAV